MRTTSFGPLLFSVGVPLFLLAGMVTADPPAPSATLSKVAPAADLIEQVDFYVTDIRQDMADSKTYTEEARHIARDAHTLAALSFVLAEHDEDHRLKSAAPALLAASRELARSKDYDAAQAAFKKVETAAAGTADPAATVKLEKVAGLGQLMKQASFVNNRLKRNLRRFEMHQDECARDAALLAAIGQVIVFDTHEVHDPADMDKWYRLCGEMRDTAGSLNAAVHAGDKSAADAAFVKVGKNCETCHESFRAPAAQ